MAALIDPMLPTLKRNHDLHHLHGMLSMMERAGCKFRTAIDGGAHRGIWTRQLAMRFRTVYAFEPRREHFRHLPHRTAFCFGLALWDEVAQWSMVPGTENDGQWRIGERDDSSIDSVASTTIDIAGLINVDFIKLDVEGAELFAARGARETIERCRPWVMIELNGLDQKNFGVERDAAAHFLRSLGMREHGRWNKDFLFGW